MEPKGAKNLTEGSLEFETLPLIEVALQHGLATPIPAGVAVASEIAKKLEDSGIHIHDLDSFDLKPGTRLVFGSGIFRPEGFKISIPANGIDVSIQRDVLTARWLRTSGQPYPRFQTLLDALLLAQDHVEECVGFKLEVDSVSMVYSNQIAAVLEDGRHAPDPWPFSFVFTDRDKSMWGDPYELNAGWDQGGGLSRRVHFQFRAGKGIEETWYLLITSSTWVPEVGPIEASVVHDDLIKWFPELLSNQAKEKYGYKS